MSYMINASGAPVTVACPPAEAFSIIVPPEYALLGLLHDASEAYLSDLSSPVKWLPELAGYRQLEKVYEQQVARRFGFPATLPDCVKHADLVALATEKRDLMPPCEPLALLIEGLEWFDARPLFLERYAEITSSQQAIGF